MRTHLPLSRLFVLLLAPLVLLGCSRDEDDAVTSIFFSVEDDEEIGNQVKNEIRSNPSEYPILSRSQHPQAYAFMDSILTTLLNSGEVQYADRFNCELDIINDDQTLNAFCAPGGYICVYTGLIKFLSQTSDLAGVVGHEIAHADRRHTIRQLELQAGASTLLGLLTGSSDPGLITQIALSVTTLSYSREFEREADDFSVRYLCDTPFKSDGASTFFAQLIAEGATGNTPTFLSTHPNPENRVEDITAKAVADNCNLDYPSSDSPDYAAFKALLP